MAHEIESMIFAGKTPWHGLGTQVSETITTREALTKAGLDWSVRLDPLATPAGVVVTHRAAVRSTDGSVLGVVGPDWEPLQNAEAFAWFDPFLATGEATLETAMSLRGGQKVAILARIATKPLMIVPQADDRVEQFILLSNAHDGRTAVRVGFTPIRVVCANTLAMAHESEASKLLRVFHTGRAVETLKEIREVMNVARADFEATAEQYRALASRQLVSDDLKRYVKRVFKTKVGALRDAAGEEAITLGANAEEAALDEATIAPSSGSLIDDVLAETERKGGILDKIAPLFEHGRGNDLPGVKGTWWAAYNAVSEYLSHERGKDQDVRVNSVLLSHSSHLNRRALNIASDMAAGARAA